MTTYNHSFSCSYPEGCDCGSSEINADIRQAYHDGAKSQEKITEQLILELAAARQKILELERVIAADYLPQV